MTDNDQFLNSGKSTTTKKKVYVDEPLSKQNQNQNSLQNTKWLPKRKIIYVATRN